MFVARMLSQLIRPDELKNVCIWNRRNADMGANYRSKWEGAFLFKMGTSPHMHTFGLGGEGRHRSNEWDNARVSGISKTGRDELAMHPKVRPAAMVVDALKEVSSRGPVVANYFGRSGSTLIAAEKCGRRARLIKYDTGFCDTIAMRRQLCAGKQAILGETGATFEEGEGARLESI